MTYKFAKQFDDYKLIRTEYLRAKFHELSPQHAKMDQNDRRYQKLWAYYLKNTKKTALDPSGRCFCFLAQILTSPEWRVADLDGYLQSFWQALQNQSPIDSKDALQVAIMHSRYAGIGSGI